MLDAKCIFFCGGVFFLVVLKESLQFPWVWLLRALQTLLDI